MPGTGSRLVEVSGACEQGQTPPHTVQKPPALPCSKCAEGEESELASGALPATEAPAASGRAANCIDCTLQSNHIQSRKSSSLVTSN
jgi:hypothetical protein